jgi:hypothetical protein
MSSAAKKSQKSFEKVLKNFEKVRPAAKKSSKSFEKVLKK